MNEPGPSGSKRSQPPSVDQQLQPKICKSTLEGLKYFDAKHFLSKYQKQFTAKVATKEIAIKLKNQSLISEHVRFEIECKDSETASQLLFADLVKTGTPEKIRGVCSVMASETGYHAMNSLGRAILDDEDLSLPTRPAATEFSSGQEQTRKTLCDNPHIQRLKRHVMNCYKYGNLNPAESVVRVEYIRLAVLETQLCRHDEDKEDRDEIDKLGFLERFRTCGSMDGNVQEYVGANDLLKPATCNLGKRTKVVYGQAGIGKTTLLTHICRSLTLDKPIQSSYALVLYFPLRKKEVSSAKTLSDLLSYYASAKSLSAVEQAIEDSGDKEVLFIFDGADEVQDLLSLEERGVFQNILEGRTLPQADVIVSSRPGGLPQLTKQNMATFYEIHGLDLSSIEKYIKEFFKRSSPKNGERLWKELQSRDDLMGGAHIPMNLLIFCHILGKGGLPFTLTECYKQYIVQVYNRESPEKKWTDFDDCPEDVKELLLSLGRLAYTGMMSTPSTFVFEEKQVKEAFKTRNLDASAFKGLLHEHHSPFGYIFRSTFNFSHATQQELFCAYYISHLPVEKQIAFLRNSMSQPKFSMVLRFYAGLTRLADEQVVDTILYEPGFFYHDAPFLQKDSTTADSSICTLDNYLCCDNGDPGLLHLFHFLYESHNSKLTQSVVRQFDGFSITFVLFLTSFDSRVIAHCLRESRKLRELMFILFSMSADNLEHVLSCTSSILMSDSLSQIHKLTLKLGPYHLTLTGVSHLKDGLSKTALEDLELSMGHADMSAIAAIFEAPRLKRLKLFTLSAPSVSDSDLEVAQSFARNTRIKKLEVFSPPSLLLPVVKGLAANTCVEELILHGYDDGDDGVDDGGVGQALATACRTNTTLKDIDLTNVSPFPLMEVLCSREVPLERLAIREHDTGKYSSRALETLAKNMKVKRFKKDSNVLQHWTPEYWIALTDGLSGNKFLREVYQEGVPVIRRDYISAKLNTVEWVIRFRHYTLRLSDLITEH